MSELKTDKTGIISHSDADKNPSEQQTSHPVADSKDQPSENVAGAEKAVETDKNTAITAQPTEGTNPAENISPSQDYPRRNKKLDIYRKAISDLHCPFVWQADLHINTYGNHDLDLLADADDMFQETGFRFRRFIINLVLCYHNFYKRLIKESLQNLEELERMLSYSSKRECHDVLFNTINDALYHVTHSCRVYILETTQQKKQATAVLQKMKTYDSMDAPNKAGIWGIRANVYVEYGYEGVVTAVDYVKKAISLDPKNDFWHFLKGMYLGRLRRMENGLAIPDTEEISALKTAINMRQDPVYIAFTAEVYLETAKCAKKLCIEKFNRSDDDSVKQLASELDTFNVTASELFRKSVNLKPTCSHLLFRCGKGLMNLPPPHQDLKLAYDFFRKGLSINPKSSFGNHAMAMFLQKYQKDLVRAKKFLTISVNRKNFQAHLDMVRLKFIETRDSEDLIAELLEMIDIYTEIPKKRKLLGEIICFYLFINNDLVEASYYMKKLVLMHTKLSDIIHNFKSALLPTGISFPLLDIIMSQIKHEFGCKDVSEQEINVYKKFIEFLCEEDVVPVKVPENLFGRLNAIVQKGFKNQEMINTEKSDVHKKVREEGDYDANLYEDTGNAEYLKYYRDQHLVKKTETVDEFFAIFKERRDTNRVSNEGKHHRREKERRQDKYDEDMRDRRDGSRSRRKSKNKRKNSSGDYDDGERRRRKSPKSGKRSRRSPDSRKYSSSASSSESESDVSNDRSDSKRAYDRKGNRAHKKYSDDGDKVDGNIYDRKHSESKYRRKNGRSDEESPPRKTKPADEEKIVRAVEKLRIEETNPNVTKSRDKLVSCEQEAQKNTHGDTEGVQVQESKNDDPGASEEYVDDEQKRRERKMKTRSDASERSDHSVKTTKEKKKHESTKRGGRCDDSDYDRHHRRRDSDDGSFSDCSVRTKQSKRRDSPKRKEKRRHRSKYSDDETRVLKENRERSDESLSSDSSVETKTSVTSSRSKTKKRDAFDRKRNRKGRNDDSDASNDRIKKTYEKHRHSKKSGKYDEDVHESDERRSSSRQSRRSERRGRRRRQYSEGDESVGENGKFDDNVHKSNERRSSSRQSRRSERRGRRRRQYSEGDESVGENGKFDDNVHKSNEHRSSSRQSKRSERRGRRRRQYSEGDESVGENRKFDDNVHESDERRSSSRLSKRSERGERRHRKHSDSDESRSSRKVKGEKSRHRHIKNTVSRSENSDSDH